MSAAFTFPSRDEVYGDAYHQGKRARRAGFTLADNPYPERTTQWHAYRDGWCKAHKEER